MRMAIWHAGNTMSNILSGFLAAGILTNMDDVLGLHAWQWFFIIEGAASILVAAVAYILLPSWPHNTRWLTPEEAEMAQYRVQLSNGGVDEGVGGTWDGVKDAARYVTFSILLNSKPHTDFPFLYLSTRVWRFWVVVVRRITGPERLHRLFASRINHHEVLQPPLSNGDFRDPYTWLFCLMHFALVTAQSFKDFLPSVRSTFPFSPTYLLTSTPDYGHIPLRQAHYVPRPSSSLRHCIRSCLRSGLHIRSLPRILLPHRHPHPLQCSWMQHAHRDTERRRPLLWSYPAHKRYLLRP